MESVNFYLPLIYALLAAFPSQSDLDSPELFLERIKAIGEPDFDASRKSEEGYLENYKREQHILYQEKASVLLDLCRAHPNDARYAKWMNRRWVLLGWNQNPEAVAAEVLADIEKVITSEKNKQVLQDAAYWRTFYQCHLTVETISAKYRQVKEFCSAYPDDPRGAEILSLIVDNSAQNRALQIEIYEKLARQYAGTHYGNFAPGMVRRLKSLGERFELDFADAITGKRLSVAALNGQIVVIDFWATTCVPCVVEMPHLKKLYNKYHQRGVEFIGVSLDESKEEGGLKALRRFVRKHDIPWPQYYQGNGYDSEYSKSWGVGSAPTVFVLDREGKLRSTSAQDDLEAEIRKWLGEP